MAINGGNPAPPDGEGTVRTPSKRSTWKNKQQAGLQREISCMTKAQTLEYLGVARRHFKDTFEVDGDKAFINHVSASVEMAQAYADGTGDAPDADDLHFHMEDGS